MGATVGAGLPLQISASNKNAPLRVQRGQNWQKYLCQFKALGRKGLRVSGKGSKGFFLTFSTDAFFYEKFCLFYLCYLCFY